MCLILFGFKKHPKYKLVLMANRDEFYDRPTQHAKWWAEGKEWLGGRDLQENGTWMGVTKMGRIAALTNYRDPASIIANAPTRGRLITDYLSQDTTTVKEYLSVLKSNRIKYNGYNILAGDQDQMYYYSNTSNVISPIKSGIYGLSNALLDTPWPKTSNGKNALQQLLNYKEFPVEKAFEALHNATPASDHLLPDTGIGSEKEKALSSIFIQSPNYGTRCSTIILIDIDNKVSFYEKSYIEAGYNAYTFQITQQKI